MGRNFEVGGGARSLVLADLNGDGKLDAVTANSIDNTVSVLLGTGDGAFQTRTDYAAGAGVSSVAVGDLNGDGKLDLVASNGQNNSITVFLGRGDGTFPIGTEYPVRYTYQDLVLGDVNGDGQLDLVAAAAGSQPDDFSDAISVSLGNGDGTFQTHKEYAAAVGVRIVRLGDLNGDGVLDAVTANWPSILDHPTANAISVLIGNGDGSFQTHVEYGLPGTSGPTAADVAIGDMNTDGIPDLVVADGLFPDVFVMLGNGDGTFQSPVIHNTGGPSGLFGVAIADLNGDSKLDLVVTSEALTDTQYGKVPILFGLGDGTFRAGPLLEAGTAYSSTVVTGDLSGDGKLDVVFTSEAPHNLRYWVNTRMNQ